VKNIAILIPIYNRISTTIKGLESLGEALAQYRVFGKSSVTYSIVVIDDGSTDGSSDWILSNYKNIHVLNGNGHLWWTGSINKGANYAIQNLNSDYLLLWNDDIFPSKNYFIEIENILSDPSFKNTVVGSKIVFNNNPEKIWSVGGYFNKFSGYLKMEDKIQINPVKIIECDWLPGMGTLVPVSNIKLLELKWDDKHFPQYHGDSDFTLRCNSKGMRIITNTDLLLSNNTETTGFNKKNNLKDLYESFTSIKSNYNIKVDFKFYSRHGYLPIAYFGMLSKYFFFVGGFIKYWLFKPKRKIN
jgi:GT2 family glycosyltransferase